jgi:outer membrane protein insertion porin family
VQFGQPLRGYPEFSITPRGFDPGADTFNAASRLTASPATAYFSSPRLAGAAVQPAGTSSTFFDAGNNFARVVSSIRRDCSAAPVSA